MHFLNFFVLSLYHGGKTLWFCFVSSYFSSVKCFLFCELSKHFKVHCNAFEKSLGHSTFPHGKITWFETIDTCTKMSVIPIPWKPWHLLAQNRYRCSLSHNLSERNGFAFSARKKNCLWNSKNIKKRKRKKKHCLKMHETTCNSLVYLSACQKIKVKDHSDMLYDHYLLHISLKKPVF